MDPFNAAEDATAAAATVVEEVEPVLVNGDKTVEEPKTEAPVMHKTKEKGNKKKKNKNTTRF